MNDKEWKEFHEARMKKLEEREKALEIKKAEYKDDRREKTAVFHTQIREMTKTCPEAAELFDQSWDEKDAERSLQLQKRAVEILPPELSKLLESILSSHWKVSESATKAIKESQKVIDSTEKLLRDAEIDAEKL